jgi:hypothetical protein
MKQSIEQYKSEADLQAQCVKWFDRAYMNQKFNLFLVYNNPPNAIMGAILKSMGLKRGISDLVYFCPNLGLTYWIEMKLPGEKQSDHQKDFENLVVSFGFEYKVIDDLTKFVHFINQCNGRR